MSEDAHAKFGDEEKAADFHPSSGKHHETGVEILEAHDGINRETGIIGKMWGVVTYLDSFGVEVR